MAIFEAEYSNRTPLYEDSSGPRSVLRLPMPVAEIHSHTVEHDKVFANLLIDLSDKYGIQSPGMSFFQREDAQGNPEVYIEGQWVEGKNLSDYASEIPSEVVRQGIKAIIAYYRDARTNGGEYLTDLRPSNIIYGRVAGETIDHLYFIDLEPLWADDKGESPMYKSAMDRVLPELWLLIKEGQRNGEDWEDLAQELSELEGLPNHP